MSPQGKLDLGAKAEAMLASWPAPPDDDAAWEARAAKIVAAAKNAPRADDALLAALVAKPALEAEPGEDQSSNVSAATSARRASGEKAMSDSNPGSAGKPSNPAPSIPPTSAAPSKRPSLKELAARASQAGAAAASSPVSMRPTAPAPESVLPPRSSTPTPSVPPSKASIPPPSKPLEAGKEDSGRVDLNAINQAATPAQVAAAAAAKPATHDLVSDAAGEDKPAEAKETKDDAKVKNIADARAKKAKKKSDTAKKTEAASEAAEPAKDAEAPVAAKTAEPEKSGGGTMIAIVAVLALAAGGFLFWKNKQQPPPAPVAAVVQEKPAAEPVATETQKIAEAPKPESTGLSIDSLPNAAPAESAKAAPGTKVAAAPAPTETAAPPPTPAPEPTPAPLTTATAPTGKVGDLSSAMAQAVGGSADKPVNAEDATPAAGRSGSQSIPEQPPQGSVASAIRAVAPGAKACVAGADDVSNASVTFNSSGSVSSVNVSGWAAKNGKTACVKSALQGAKVGPFSKPSFTVSVPIRP